MMNYNDCNKCNKCNKCSKCSKKHVGDNCSFCTEKVEPDTGTIANLREEVKLLKEIIQERDKVRPCTNCKDVERPPSQHSTSKEFK